MPFIDATVESIYSSFRLYLVEKFLDPNALFNGFVVVEGQFRNAPEVMKALAERSAGITRGRLQSLRAFSSAAASLPKDGDEDACMTKIRRHLYRGDRREADARILNFALDDLAELDSKLFFDSIDSSSLHVYTISMLLWIMHSGSDPLRFFGGFLQDLIEETLRRTDSDDADLGPLPQVLMVDFGNRRR